MKLLITGGCGFLGSNLASHAIRSDYEVIIFDNLSRAGSFDNFLWLKELGKFTFIYGDIRNKNDIESVIKIKPDAIFHLAGQVAMTTSIENPYGDFEINALGTINLLDSVRKYSKDTIIIYSSTNKVYGDLEQYNYYENNTRYTCPDFPLGFDELVPLNFSSPYGCSKGCADQYMLDYNRVFGLKTVVFRHSSMYGGRQFATYDQGWVGWFCQKAWELKNKPGCEPFSISGNGKQVRDILFADDMVKLYFAILELRKDEIYGNAFNIGGSMEQSLSLLELFSKLNFMLGIELKYINLPFRNCDQKIFVANIAKIKAMTGWCPKIGADEGISRMMEWIKND